MHNRERLNIKVVIYVCTDLRLLNIILIIIFRI